MWQRKEREEVQAEEDGGYNVSDCDRVEDIGRGGESSGIRWHAA